MSIKVLEDHQGRQENRSSSTPCNMATCT